MKHRYPYELHLDRVWKAHLAFYKAKDIAYIPWRILKAVKIGASDVTYYPELERKNLPSRIADNVVWVVKNLECNGYYYSYGLDIKNFRKAEDFLPFREFKLQREGAHYLYPEKYRFSGQILLRDKYIFNCYLAEVLGRQYVPEMIGVMADGQVHLHAEKKSVPIGEFLDQDRRFFCKLIDGECAESAFLIEIRDGVIKNGKEEIDRDAFIEKVANARMILQEVLQQHEEINKINPHCINTIRIITVRGNSGKIHVFAASLRVGTKADAFVDNRAVGGAAVGIDKNGRLKKYGFPHQNFGTKIEKHPVTGTVFEGIQIPYWDEVIELVTKAHQAVINVQSIGWDVAITPSNPLLIEGNDNWEVQNPQDAHGGLKKRWYRLIND